jgi:hypothetical protein
MGKKYKAKKMFSLYGYHIDFNNINLTLPTKLFLNKCANLGLLMRKSQFSMFL